MVTTVDFVRRRLWVVRHLHYSIEVLAACNVVVSTAVDRETEWKRFK